MILPFDAVGEGPPVVLLHAGIADRTMWREHLQPIADSGRRAFALDLPGFGEAGLEPGPQSPWEDVLQTLQLVTGGPVALVGNSYGGAIALRIAAIAPSAVSALALISAPAPGADDEPSDELAAIWEAEESALEQGDIDRAVAAIVDGWTLPGAPEELRERIAVMQRRAFLLQQATPGADLAPRPAGGPARRARRGADPRAVRRGHARQARLHRGRGADGRDAPAGAARDDPSRRAPRAARAAARVPAPGAGVPGPARLTRADPASRG